MYLLPRWAKHLFMYRNSLCLQNRLRPLPSVKKDAEGNVHDAFTDPS